MIVDANVWISAVVKRDRFYQRSRHWLRSQTGAHTTLLVPALAIVEVAGAVARVENSASRGRHVARWMLRSPNIEVIAMTEMLIERGAQIAADHQIRGSDAVYAAAAVELSVPLVTWDAELQRRAAALVNVIQP